MKLLILSNNPSRASYRQRIGIYVERLAERGIEGRLEQLPKSLIGRARLYAAAREYDGVLLHKKTLNAIDARLLRRFARRIIYDLDDAIMYSPRRPEQDKRSHRIPFYRTVSMVDHVIAGNGYLADHARPYCPSVHVLPTGLCLGPYRAARRRPNGDVVRLVWIGSKSTLRYLEQITEVLTAVGRRYPNVVLRIIADQFTEPDGIPVEKHSWSGTREAQELLDSDIGLAPLPDNAFTRGKCAFKILQYFAASLPCVASPVGMNRDLVRDDETGFSAQSRREWIDTLGRLIEDETLRRSMGERGNRLVQEYDQQRIGERFCDLIEQALRA